MNYEEIKETTPTEVVSTVSNTYFDTTLGFNPDLGFVPYTKSE